MYYSLARSPLRLPGSADTYNINQYTYSILQYYSYIMSYIYIYIQQPSSGTPYWCFSACAFDAPHRTWHGTWKRFAPGEKQSLRPQEQFQAVCAPCVAADGESVHSTFALDTFWANAVLFNVVLLIIPIVFPIWFSSINIPDCMQCFEGFKLSMVSGRSAWQFAQVHHVNRYPPNVAPKPGRLADGLTEAGTSSLTSQWFLILRISPDGWESLGQMHLTIWCTATFHAAAAVVFLANVGCQ